MLASAALLLNLQVGAGAAETITPAMRAADERLARHVTVHVRRIQVADLLDELSRQTGVTVAADLPTGAGDPFVMVHVEGVPLADVLDGLWALLSYRRAEWSWLRTGAPGRREYTLTRSYAARRLAAELRGWVQLAFERESDLAVAASRVPVNERAAYLKQHAEGTWLGGATEAQLATRMGQEHTWVLLRAFGAGLSAAERLSLLRGSGTATVSMDLLSHADRDYIAGLAPRQLTVITNGVLQPPRPLDSVTFRVARFGAMATPSLTAQLPDMGGPAVVGGRPAEAAFVSMLRARWTLPGDAAHAPPSAQRPADPAPGSSPTPDDAPRGTRLEEFVECLAAGSGIPTIALLPPTERSAPEAYRGDTVAERLERPHLSAVMSKWRRGMLLFSSTRWHEDEHLRVPAADVRRLRGSADATTRWLPLDVLLQAGAWGEPAMQSMGEFFPILRVWACRAPILALLHRSALLRNQVRSSRGAPLCPALLDAMRCAGPGIGPLATRWPHCAVKLTVTHTGTGGDRQRRIALVLTWPGREPATVHASIERVGGLAETDYGK